jgi:hypothetical protein
METTETPILRSHALLVRLNWGEEFAADCTIRQRVTASRNLDGVLDGSFLRLCWKFVEQSFEGFD